MVLVRQSMFGVPPTAFGLAKHLAVNLLHRHFKKLEVALLFEERVELLSLLLLMITDYWRLGGTIYTIAT